MATVLTSKSPDDSPYDAIVVGSGAGGAPLAARLAEEGWKVLVLEAGPNHAELAPESPAREITEVPVLHGPCTEQEDVSWEFFVKHYDKPKYADPKWDAKNDGVFYPRATGIGGCTIHNAMITIAGPAVDWDEMAWFLDDPTWRGETMRTYFERVERCEFLPKPTRLPQKYWGRFIENVLWLFGKEIDPTGGRHGFDGWLHTTVGDFKIGLQDPHLVAMLFGAAKTCALEGLVAPKRFIKAVLQGRPLAELDPNHARRQNAHPEGLALIPTAIKGECCSDKRGRRSTPRERLLEAQQKFPARLTIVPDCLVTSVILDADGNGGWKATGVNYLQGARIYGAVPPSRRSKTPGKPGTIHARKEVILAGGAFNSPQLLMLSGIGPREHLTKSGIACVIDSPGVGSNLQDRYEVTVVSKMSSNFSLLDGASLKLTPADKYLSEWRNGGTGLYASNGAVLGILKRSRPELPQPDLFIFGLPLKFLGYSKGYSDVKERDLFTWAILKAHTKNRDGTVRLRSKDPLERPEINFHYFQEVTDPNCDDSDIEAVLAGVRFVRKIASHSKGVVEEFHPGTDVNTDDKIREFIRREAWGHHACGTCRMGRSSDGNAVVDSQFRVLAEAKTPAGERLPVKGLRVVDASIFWKIPGYFIVTNIYMASEKAADTIMQAWQSGKE